MNKIKIAAVSKLCLLSLIVLQGSQVMGAASLFQKDGKGLIKPFKVKSIKLADFTRSYSQFTGTVIEVGGGTLDANLVGGVTLLVPKPISSDALTEMMHQVLQGHGYVAIDAAQGGGWTIVRSRDARDGNIPTYDSSQFPVSYRLMTVVHSLKYINSNSIAGILRNFMPAQSRIIPLTESQVALTDVGRNIQKLIQIISLLDVAQAKDKMNEPQVRRNDKQSCSEKEQRIGTLVVEKLEIQNSSSGGNSAPPFKIIGH